MKKSGSKNYEKNKHCLLSSLKKSRSNLHNLLGLNFIRFHTTIYKWHPRELYNLIQNNSTKRDLFGVQAIW